MNVLVLSDLFPTPATPYRGVFVLEQLKALNALGVSTITVCPIPWAPRAMSFLPRVKECLSVPDSTDIDDVHALFPRVAAPGGRFFPIYGWLYYLSLRRVIARIVRREHIDLIHAHAVMPCGYAAALLSRDLHIPAVCTMHGSEIRVYPFLSRATRATTRWALRNLRHHIAVSDNVASVARQLEPAIGSIEIIHNGADAALFRPQDKLTVRRRLGIPADQRVIAYVGNLVPIKAVDVLINAFAKLTVSERSTTLLYLIGSGHERKNLDALAVKLGIADRVRFMGTQPHDSIPDWLSAADCLVLPSHSEGLPTIIPEAMMCRTPVVATAVGGVPEIVKHGDTGLLVEPANPDALSRALRTVISIPPSLTHMIDRAARFARTNLTWEANARKTLAVYERMMAPDSQAAQTAHSCISSTERGATFVQED